MERRHHRLVGALVAILVAGSCTSSHTDGTGSPAPHSSAHASPEPSGPPIDSREPVLEGPPIDVASLTGRILLSSEDDVFTANADGTDLIRVTRKPGPEFDPAWSPDAERIVYRDSRRGINQDDEIYVVGADGTARGTSPGTRGTIGGRTGPPTAAPSCSTPIAMGCPWAASS
jgi:WD40-like Beta Propeller Repeat